MLQPYTYRRLREEIFWHVYQECKYWPTENYDEVTSDTPPRGRFCLDCLRRQHAEFRAEWESWFLKGK